MNGISLKITTKPVKAPAAASRAAAVIGRAVAINPLSAPGSFSQL
ncbi:MAG: hypothetical protein ACK2TT_00710 [Anaerolineales bacterium]